MINRDTKTKEIALLFGTFLIAISGLVYELLEGTLSSYLLGDSIYHFSLVIGLFMSSMGIGAWLSRFIDNHLPKAFLLLQFSISLLGGFSSFILFFAFAYIQNYEAFLYLITIGLGSMLGFEIPLVIRILKESFSLKTNISNVFTLDYIGALFASILFPLVLVPQLGLMQTAFLFGGLNLFVGAMAWSIFRKELGKKYLLAIIIIGIILTLGFIQSNSLTSIIENKLYKNSIIYSKQTPYQKLIITSTKGRIQFYINDNYPADTKFQVRVFDADGKEIQSSAVLNHNILAIEFRDINITPPPSPSSNNYKVTLKTTEKIAGYEIHLKFTDDIGSNIALDNDFLNTTGRTVSDLGPNVDNSTKIITFGAFSFGTKDGVSGDFEPLIFDSNDSKGEISIVKHSCVDVDANEVACDVMVLDR